MVTSDLHVNKFLNYCDKKEFTTEILFDFQWLILKPEMLLSACKE